MVIVRTPQRALARLNVPLYSSLEAETGIPTDFRQVGSLSALRTEARMTETLYGVMGVGRS